MTNSVSNKLISSLNSQCFLDFPSGNGSWNSGNDYGEDGNLISEEELLDLIANKQSPWKTENELSNEIISIKKELIKCNGHRSLNKITQRLRSLRLLDRNIVTLDDGLRALKNIYELILSANYIDHIDAVCLPSNLRVLELYSNKIDSLEFCCHKDMPPLEHFGVGANQIMGIIPLSSSVLISSLVSLDLGKNFLTDLNSSIATISQLKKIKTLVLGGNPLSLLATYRGFVIDSVDSLTCLDDTMISADERYSVKKMAAISDSFKKLCRFKISIPSIKNIPAKEIPENMPEEPVIKTEYYVKFWFPTKFSDKIKVPTSDEEKEPDISMTMNGDSDADIMYLHKSDNFVRLNPEITLNWTEDIRIDNVGKFCEFLDEPFRITIMEETKYLYSPENLPSKAPSRMESQNSKRRAQKSATKHAPKDANKTKKDTGKKKKIDESKLVLHSKTIRRLAEYFVNISLFKSGDTSYDQVLTADIIPHCDARENETKSKKTQETKGKKTSAKDRSKSAEKSTTGKVAKPAKISNEEIEPIKPVECHLILNLLTFKNVKSLEDY